MPKVKLEIEDYGDKFQLVASLKINEQPFVVQAPSVPELLRELATSVEVWEKYNGKTVLK